MKRKPLIQLMKEAGIMWPEEANYATQDKYTNNVFFYKDIPEVCKHQGLWSYCVELNGCRYGGTLNERCHKWSKTIVTKEDYEG